MLCHSFIHSKCYAKHEVKMLIMIDIDLFLDSGPYIAELLGKFEDSALRHNISSMLIPRSRLDIGELIGKGNY